MITEILLDMDGVLADFVPAICRAHGRENPYDNYEARGVWDIEKLWGITKAEFWAPTKTVEFWSTIEPTEEFSEILALAEDAVGREGVAICTAPSLADESIIGKRRWIEKHLPESYKHRTIFARAKGFLAGPSRLLIDDRDKNILEFRLGGGYTCLLPRPWNAHHYRSESVMKGLLASSGQPGKPSIDLTDARGVPV